MTAPQDRISAHLVITSPAGAIFDVLADPSMHVLMDGSGMVRGSETTDRVSGTGDVFRMDVHHPDAGDYQTDNHVTAYVDGRALAWQTSAIDSEPAGWEWKWGLDPIDVRTTMVTVTYDWSRVSDPAVLERLTFPIVPQTALDQSLRNLAEVVNGRQRL